MTARTRPRPPPPAASPPGIGRPKPPLWPRMSSTCEGSSCASSRKSLTAAPYPAAPGPGLDHDHLVIYELHVGTFSDEGACDGAVPHLAALKELGVTAIEVMPVATFPGNRGWGYDGIYLYAVHPAYGGPEAFARLV